MKLILHAGMPKAGSSALQRWLQANRRDLARKGVVYPWAPVMPHNHHILVAGCAAWADLPRILRHKSKKHDTNLGKAFDKWRAYLADVASEEPDLVVLSSEALFNMSSANDGEAFRYLGEYLHRLFVDIQVVFYVRKPSDFYLSSCQQILKASHRIRVPSAITYRCPIEMVERFVSDSIDIHVYDDVKSVHGGVVEHFGALYDSRIARLASSSAKSKRNSSFSAEGMSILHSFRKHVHGKRRNIFTPDTNALIQAIGVVDPTVEGFRRPSLHPDVAKQVDQSSEDALWLKERFGIEFADLDYARIGDANECKSAARIEDICPVDSERRELLLMHVVSYMAQGDQ